MQCEICRARAGGDEKAELRAFLGNDGTFMVLVDTVHCCLCPHHAREWGRFCHSRGEEWRELQDARDELDAANVVYQGTGPGTHCQHTTALCNRSLAYRRAKDRMGQIALDWLDGRIAEARGLARAEAEETHDGEEGRTEA